MFGFVILKHKTWRRQQIEMKCWDVKSRVYVNRGVERKSSSDVCMVFTFLNTRLYRMCLFEQMGWVWHTAICYV